MPKKGAPAKSTVEQLSEMDEASLNVYEAMRVKLMGATTLAELYAVADEDFKADVVRLPEVAQRALRDTFAFQRNEVKGKVKMDVLANRAVTIKEPPDFPPKSPEFPNDFCVIKGTLDDTGERFECVSSAIRIVRHFQRSNPDSYPQHLTFYKEDADSMAARHAKPNTSPMWLVRRMTSAPARSADGIPF